MLRKCFWAVLMLVAYVAPAVADEVPTVDAKIIEVGVYQVPRYHHSSVVYAEVVNQGSDTLCGFDVELTTTINRCVLREHVDSCMAPGDTLTVTFRTPIVPDDENQMMVTITAAVVVADDEDADNDRISKDYPILSPDDDISVEQILSPVEVQTIGDTIAVEVRLCNMGDYAVTEVPLAINYNNQFFDTLIVNMLELIGYEGLAAGQCMDYTSSTQYRVTIGYTTLEVTSLAPYDTAHANDTLFILFTSETGFDGIDEVGVGDCSLVGIPYPNPATSSVNVAVEALSPVSYFVVNQQGRVVLRGQSSVSPLSFDVVSLPVGTYQLVADVAGRRFVRTFLVVH